MSSTRPSEDLVLKEASPVYAMKAADNSAHLQLEDSLALTPWDRMLANDDIVNFGDSLRAAMEKHHAKSR